MQLFLFGTLWFWLLSVIAVILIVATTEVEDSNSWGYVILIGTLCLMYFFGNKQSFNETFSYIAQNPGVIILTTLAYLALGVVWSLVKWYAWLKARVAKAKANNSMYYASQYQVSENKERIVNWMMYWPFSAFWTLIDEPVKKTFKALFSALEKTYQRMADRATKELQPNKK